MYRFMSTILFLLLMSVGFTHYHFTIVAQDNEFDCRRDLNIFLFEYNHPLWEEYTEINEATACDIHHFWMQVDGLPTEYQPPNYIVQEYSSFPYATPYNFIERTQNGACNIRPSFTNLSYYCTSPYGIVIAEPAKFLTFLEWKRNQRETMAVVLMLAHEWAHHIQLTVLNDRNNISELQAECFVGAYFRFAVSNPNLTLIDFSQADWDALMQVVPVDSNERVGNTEQWADISIGDRGLALRMGYQEGTSSCLSNW